MTGPLYERQMPAMPGANEVHLLPSGYWKIVAVEEWREVRVAGFVLEQETGRRESPCDSDEAASPREIEMRAGLNFFHASDRRRQDALELGEALLRGELGCAPSGPGEEE